MASTSGQIPVYLEAGKKRVFAGALAWPGWCVSARDDSSALQALFASGPRYARILESSGVDFATPGDIANLAVAERLAGTSTTDFGAPDVAPASDGRTLGDDERHRLEALLWAIWKTFDATAEQASGRELRKGPRGGGRDVDAIVSHVLGAEHGYLSALGWRFRTSKDGDPVAEKTGLRAAMFEGLAASAAGEIPALGPRGGQRWLPRYFVRRVAWHAVEHTWEIEDRILPSSED